MNTIRKSIMDAVVDLFNEKGMKFTMDDISKKLHISKKTIYKEFDDKDELFYATVDYGFAAIKQKEAEIIADDSLDLIDKISKVIVCLPDNYRNIDFRQVYQLREKYPVVYSRIAGKIETDWENRLTSIASPRSTVTLGPSAVGRPEDAAVPPLSEVLPSVSFTASSL